MRLGGLEAGGTKMVCGIGNERGDILERVSFPTTTPEETMRQVSDFFRSQRIEALGIGSFGPVDLDKRSITYGSITATPKLPWQNFNILGSLRSALDVPIGFDTDVNAAALGESCLGAAAGLDSCVYTTVGTGIGSGIFVEGRLLQGLMHPETGHIPVRRHPDDAFSGCCPFHGDCLEGMASGPALEQRWGCPGHELEKRREVWELEAHYLAQAVASFIYILSPKKIIFGGGVMKQGQLFPLIRHKVAELLNGYVRKEEVINGLEQYIVPPGLGDNAGLSGALQLAVNALKSKLAVLGGA